jgi:hypothetical protein
LWGFTVTIFNSVGVTITLPPWLPALRNRGVKGFLVGLTKMTLVTVVCGCFLCADWFVLDSFLSPEGVRYRLLEAHRPSFGVRLLEGLLAQLGTYDLCGAPV